MGRATCHSLALSVSILVERHNIKLLTSSKRQLVDAVIDSKTVDGHISVIRSQRVGYIHYLRICGCAIVYTTWHVQEFLVAYTLCSVRFGSQQLTLVCQCQQPPQLLLLLVVMRDAHLRVSDAARSGSLFIHALYSSRVVFRRRTSASCIE